MRHGQGGQVGRAAIAREPHGAGARHRFPDARQAVTVNRVGAVGDIKREAPVHGHGQRRGQPGGGTPPNTVPITLPESCVRAGCRNRPLSARWRPSPGRTDSPVRPGSRQTAVAAESGHPRAGESRNHAGRHFAHAVPAEFGNIKIAEAINSRLRGAFNGAFTARAPSPAEPAVPVPATVEIVPCGEIFRTRLLPQIGDIHVAGQIHRQTVGQVEFGRVAGPPSPP